MRKLFQSKCDVCDIANCQKLPSSISTPSIVKHCHVVFWSHYHVPDSIKVKTASFKQIYSYFMLSFKRLFFHWKNTWNCMNFEVRYRRVDWTKVGKIFFPIHFKVFSKDLNKKFGQYVNSIFYSKCNTLVECVLTGKGSIDMLQLCLFFA